MVFATMVNIQCGDVGPDAATEILVFDVHGRVWSARPRGMFAAAPLHTGLFISGDDELIAAQ